MVAVLDALGRDTIQAAAAAIADGGVVGIPTDTVYGLAVDPGQPDAVERVFALKERPDDVALPVLISAWDQVAALAGTLPEEAQRLAGLFWPGPLTLVVPRSGRFTADLGGRAAGRSTVGLRWPDDPVVTALCSLVGPLAVTSANLHGEPPMTDAATVVAAFADRSGAGGLRLVVDGGTRDGTPSTVVACMGRASRCLRQGAIPWADLVG